MRQELLLRSLDDSIGNLKSQKEDLRAVRSQSAFAATVSSIVATAFGSLLPSADLAPLFSEPSFLGLNILFWLVLTCFAFSLFFSIKVLTGVKDVNFEPNPKLTLYYAEHGDDYISDFNKLIEENQHRFNENEDVIESARADIELALIFGIVQIIPWIMLVKLVATHE